MTHTKGPWNMHPLGSVEAYCEEYKQMVRIADIPDFKESDESLANFRLIAAAPDMLEMLIELNALCKIHLGCDSRTERADNIIAKATGK